MNINLIDIAKIPEILECYIVDIDKIDKCDTFYFKKLSGNGFLIPCSTKFDVPSDPTSKSTIKTENLYTNDIKRIISLAINNGLKEKSNPILTVDFRQPGVCLFIENNKLFKGLRLSPYIYLDANISFFGIGFEPIIKSDIMGAQIPRTNEKLEMLCKVMKDFIGKDLAFSFGGHLFHLTISEEIRWVEI